MGGERSGDVSQGLAVGGKGNQVVGSTRVPAIPVVKKHKFFPLVPPRFLPGAPPPGFLMLDLGGKPWGETRGKTLKIGVCVDKVISGRAG